MIFKTIFWTFALLAVAGAGAAGKGDYVAIVLACLCVVFWAAFFTWLGWL